VQVTLADGQSAAATAATKRTAEQSAARVLLGRVEAETP
jgi:hypothetical protein